MTRAARPLYQAGFTAAESKAIGLSFHPWKGTVADLKATIEILRRDEHPDRGEAAMRNAVRWEATMRLDAERLRLVAEQTARRAR